MDKLLTEAEGLSSRHPHSGFTVKQPLRPWPRPVGTDHTTGTEPRAVPGPEEGPPCQEVGSPSRAVARLMGQRLSHRTCDGCLLNFTDLPRHCFHCDIPPVFRNLQSLSVLIEHRNTRVWCPGLAHLPTWVSLPITSPPTAGPRPQQKPRPPCAAQHAPGLLQLPSLP